MSACLSFSWSEIYDIIFFVFVFVNVIYFVFDFLCFVSFNVSVYKFIQVLKKSHRDASNTRKSVVARFMTNVQEEVKSAIQKVKATIFQTVQVDDQENVELRRHYMNMPAEAVMIELLEKYRLLLSIDTPTTRPERKRHSNIEQSVSTFLMVCLQYWCIQPLFVVIVLYHYCLEILAERSKLNHKVTFRCLSQEKMYYCMNWSPLVTASWCREAPSVSSFNLLSFMCPCWYPNIRQ